MILRIEEVRYHGGHEFEFQFNDGSSGRGDIRPLLDGPALEPLLDELTVKKFEFDRKRGLLVWPNDVEIAPEALQSACVSGVTSHDG